MDSHKVDSVDMSYGYTEAPGRQPYDMERASTQRSLMPLSDHMDTGAARLEQTLEMLNVRYQSLFFASAACIVANAVMTFLGSFGITQIPSLIMSVFLIINGLMIMVLDVPGTPRWAGKHRRNIRKNMRFLTRLTGKSLWLALLGATSLMTTKATRSVNIFRIFLSTVSTIFVFAAAGTGMLIAVRKSLRLERVKGIIKENSKGAYIDCYRKYALGDPDYGMQFQEFNRMCADHTSGMHQFDIVDLYIIFNVLDEFQKSAINEREFYEWMAGSLVFL
ncbi:COPI associated protein [Babesia ovata]|uniref:COPI associated protein n=1 Tax=Babesia ovata TaxID=189622 RepID=A0A2H6KDA6_9APIC|nr:COPI associated protein [Babesia ovata]GBE60939.1 COPI associated protein [Babesia ovata]